MTNDRFRSVAFALALALAPAGCCARGPEVVVYSALDREFSAPLLAKFEQESGIRVLASYDLESTKTVGLASQLLAERQRPRCDLYWNNEILHTLRLEEEGLLEAYISPQAAHYPPQFVSPTGHWHGFAARVRVLIVNTEKLPRERWPTSIRDLADPQWKGQVGMAKPLFGTTATHAACLAAAWGDREAKSFFRQLKENVRVLSGNKQVAQAVASGELLFGWTDTDDAYIEKAVNHRPVEIIFPDQGAGQMGSLFIPDTLAMIRGGPHPEAARQLVDFLLSAEVESQLAAGPSAQFPLHDESTVRTPVAPPEPIRPMEVDFRAAAQKWQATADFLRQHFATAE